MNPIALLEVISGLEERVLVLEAEVVKLRKELADASQIRVAGVPVHEGSPEAEEEAN